MACADLLQTDANMSPSGVSQTADQNGSCFQHLHKGALTLPQLEAAVVDVDPTGPLADLVICLLSAIRRLEVFT
ncbi:unnamed protein product [Protopolystoma xenopodis]|uniref:Uncharacterized protein n=1 Tax=Protopolystoma xenopodis TaxID=117903 RepID=A0A3S5A7G8_9PLAT|nr:unnamed protein product [Protopolystoma xenopodis]